MPCILRGALLAGGESRRLGRDKALQRLGGTTLVERAAGALRAVVEEAAVFGGAADAGTLAGLPLVADEIPGRGPLAALDGAFGRWPGSAVLVLACDLPFAGEPLLRYLAERAAAGLARKGAAAPRAWVPEQDGRLQPLCAVYSPGCREVAAAALAAGPGSAHSLLDGIALERLPLTPSLPFYRPELLLNVNRAGDLERARAVLASDRAEAV